MRELKYASVRYCPHLGHNVIIEGRLGDGGGLRWECLNKDDCGYREMGCRNMLLNNQSIKSDVKHTEVG